MMVGAASGGGAEDRLVMSSVRADVRCCGEWQPKQVRTLFSFLSFFSDSSLFLSGAFFFSLGFDNRGLRWVSVMGRDEKMLGNWGLMDFNS